MHPGYVVLRSIKNKNEVLLGEISIGGLFKKHVEYIEGPAIRFSFPDECDKNTIKEYVTLTHCSFYPTGVSDLFNRHQSWINLSRSVIKQIVSYGCDFVCVSHKLSPNVGEYNEWRYSFSVSELLIISNWTICQRIVYRTLRLIYKIM